MVNKTAIENPIGHTAAQLLKELGYSSPPFDPFKIADDLGIHVSKSVTTAQIQYSGSITKNDSTLEIWVNPFDAPLRQRFTAAHELGHYVNGDLAQSASIVDTPDTLYRKDGHSDSCESQANRFAAELLMPTDYIYQEARELIDKADNQSMEPELFIREMATKFGVSTVAMQYRLQNLGII